MMNLTSFSPTSSASTSSSGGGGAPLRTVPIACRGSTFLLQLRLPIRGTAKLSATPETEHHRHEAMNT